MATSFPITLPTTKTRRLSFRQMGVVGVGTSPFTLEQQVQRKQGQVWMLDVEYAPMSRATAEAFHAALCSLNGREGTFYFGDVANPNPRGEAGGTPRVNGGSQTGEDLITDGWPSGYIAPGPLAGDWLQIGTGSSSRLYKQLVDTELNGSGGVTLTLWPRIHTAWADNTLITHVGAKGVFRLTTPGHAWDIDEMKIHGLSFSAVSVV